MGKLKNGFKKAGKNFGNNMSKGFDKAWNNDGLGGGLPGLLNGGIGSVKSKAMNEVKTNILPKISEPLVDGWKELSTTFENSGVKGHLDEIVDSLGIPTTKSAFGDVLKDVAGDIGPGIDGLNFNNFSLDSVKNLKTDASSLVGDLVPESFIPAGINPESMVSEVDMSSDISASAENFSLKNINAQKFMDGNVKSLDLKGKVVSQLKGEGAETSFDISDISKDLKENSGILGGDVTNAIDLSSIKNSFSDDFGISALDNEKIEYAPEVDPTMLTMGKMDYTEVYSTKEIDAKNWMYEADPTKLDVYEVKGDEIMKDYEFTELNDINVNDYSENFSFGDELTDPFNDPKLAGLFPENILESEYFKRPGSNENQIEKAAASGERYTANWGAQIGTWQDQYASVLNGEEGAGFGKKFGTDLKDKFLGELKGVELHDLFKKVYNGIQNFKKGGRGMRID